MKRFFQKSYSWLATLLLMVAFAVSGNASAKSVEITVGANQSITQGDISTYAAYWTGSQVNLYGDLDSEWGYLDVTSFAGAITKVEFYGASEMNTVTCLTGKVSGTSTVGVWEGSEQKVRFHSSSDIYVDKIVVYYEEGGAKECTVGVDHYADNVKPGKHEVPFSRYITIYMEELPATTSWTGSDNCPEGVTFTGENGQQIRVAQFNHWVGSDSQVGIVLEEEVTTPGVYTLHIPEGLIPFVNGKWNKEINITYTLVEPDLRPTKEVVFDFTDGSYTNDGTTSYTKDGVVITLNENRYNATAKGFRIGTDGWVSFTAPEKASLKNIQLLQESSYGVNVDFSANVGEVSGYEKTLNWAGNDAAVTLTDNYGTCYFTKAIVTLAVEEPSYVEPVLKAEDVSAEVAYYIYTDARGGLTVDGDQLKGTKEVDKDVDPTDVSQQFAFVNWNDNLYLYSLAAEKFIGKANRGNFTEEPVDPIYFKSADESTVMLYFDDSFNFNLGGSNQVTIDTWSKKDAGNSFKIMVAEKFDQTALLEKLANGGGEVEPTTTFKGVVTPNLTSVSSLEDLEGIQLTFVDADQVTVLEEDGDGIYVQNEDGSEFYAIWHPGFGGTYEVNGNVVTLRNFFSDNTDGYFNELPTGKAVLYFEDYGSVSVNNADADWDGYFHTFSVAFEGAPVAVPFELVFRNNNVVCENGQKVEAHEAGVAVDFYLENEGLTAVGKTATLYKDGNAMSFIMTLVDGTAISFLGGSSLITEPGTYTLEVPEGTYVDAAGNPSIAYYGTWVVIQKDEPVVDPDEACFNAWVALVNGEFANIANEYGNEVPAQDIVGKKPIAVAVPCIEFYTNRAGLAGMGAILGWQVVNGFLNTSYNTTLAEDYAYAKALLEAYNAAEVVTEVVVEPTYVLKAEDVSAEVAYYIYTDARGGLTVDGDQLKGTKEIGKNVDPTDVNQQFAFVNWEGNLYLYSLAAEKFIGKANRGNFTDEPVDPIYFKNAGADNVMLYFDDSFNFNLGGSNQVTIDGWKQKDAGNSFHIMVAEAFDQTDLLNKLAGPAGWNGEVLYPETAANLDDLLSYTVEFEDAKEVEASGYDVLAAVFDANGEPYAIALANGVFDVFGSISFEGSKAIVNFMKISDLTAAAQSNAKAAAARIGGFIQPEGHASVVFAGKSFKVDGEVVYDILQKDYELGENGVPTGIDTIATESNDSIYDLNGRRVNSVRSGLYIKNGVKVLY